MAGKYKIKSDYTLLRKKSQVTEKGDIFENNIMTITPLDTLFTDGQEILYSDSNFKFSTRTDTDTKRKYIKNSWVKNPDGDETWTLGDIDSAPISDESKIRIKPDYSSLRDFAYYGSAVDMVHATINHVIMYFPAELYCSNEDFRPIDRKGYYLETVTFDGEEMPVSKFKVIPNDFNINIESDFINEENITNPNRYLALSIQNYHQINPDGSIVEHIIKEKFVKNPDYDGCNDGIIGYAIVGDIKIYVYDQDGEKIYFYEYEIEPKLIDIEAEGVLEQQAPEEELIDIEASGVLEQLAPEEELIDIEASGVLEQLAPSRNMLGMRLMGRNRASNDKINLVGTSIRLNDEFVTEYFETIDEFESVLLDRQSNPIYKAVFETPYETDNGYSYVMQQYVWPSRNSWNPEINSTAFNSYLEGLINLAQYHDEFDSDNMWRMMTHEAIKNLDWTFFRENGEDVEDLSKIDTSRIGAIIQLYGRQYDGLKRYIDNIKYSNNVSYNQKNNLPDYLLTDVVELSGFEAILPNPTAKTDVVTETLYSGLSKGYSEVDGNVNFMRNLKINSHYINSLKGTRHGIQALLGLLGIKEDEYRITEHIGIAKGNDVCKMDLSKLNGISESEIDRYNCLYPSAIDVEAINTIKDNYPVIDGYDNLYDGIACKPVTVIDEDGNEEGRYVIPWYRNGEIYDSGLYFQMMGGWCKKPVIDVSELQIQGYDLKDFYPSGIIAGNKFYDETNNRIKFAADLYEMMGFLPNEVSEGDICYVGDISSLSEVMDGFFSVDVDEFKDENGKTVYSHYFILEKQERTDVVSVFDNQGWKYIYLNEILHGSSSDGLKVLYQESIKERSDGNNPHVAKKNYDSGEEYIRLFSDIFNYAIENNELTRLSTLDVESAVTTYNFNIEGGVIDNRKVDYFRPKYVSDLTEIEQTDGNSYSCLGYISEVEDMVDSHHTYLCASGGTSDTLYNPEGGNEYEEPASYSLVNLKNVKIEFSDSPLDASGFTTEWQEYIRKVVVEYLKQILPSTTIFEWGFCNDFKVIDIEAYGELEQDYSEVSLTAHGSLTQIAENIVLTAHGELTQNGTSDRVDVPVTVYGDIEQNEPTIDDVSVTLVGEQIQTNIQGEIRLNAHGDLTQSNSN